MKKHIDSKHSNDWKYCCDHCDFGADFTASLWEHYAVMHAETSRAFTEANKETLVLKMISDLNTAIIEEMEQLIKDTKSAFLELVKAVDDCVGSSFEELKSEINQKISGQMKDMFDTKIEIKQKLCSIGQIFYNLTYRCST